MRNRKSDRLVSSSHARAIVQEREVAARLGGSLVPGSGCGTQKGDVRVKGVARIECKTTMHESFSLKRSLMDKLEGEALPAGEVPVIEVEFNDGNGGVLASLAIMPVWAMDMLLKGQV